jgi:hypothetical protein
MQQPNLYKFYLDEEGIIFRNLFLPRQRGRLGGG